MRGAVVLGRYKDAIEAYNAGLAIEPGNAGLQKGLDDLRQSIRDGEVPTAGAPEAAAAAAPKANGMARPDLAPAPPAPAPAPAPAAAEESEAPPPDTAPSRPLGTGPESPQLPRK